MANLRRKSSGSSSPLSATAAPRPPLRIPGRSSPPAPASRRSTARCAYFAGMTVKLTSLAPSGGCAAKYSAARLEELLRGFVPAEAENLLVGLAPADDAVVYKLDDERALVFTLDFFPPLVDDPALFGRIAATNALNDVFAMGGLPLLALSIAAFPESLPNETLAAIFGAADEQVRAAGGILAGGHTLRDEEPKYGLAVVGTVHPNGFWPKSGARPGDALFLTKPLGTGMLLHAARGGHAARGRARGGHGRDDDAQPRGRGRAAPVLSARRHRRDRLRPARPRARDGRAKRRPDRARRRGAAALPGRARVRRGRGAHRRRHAQPRLRRPARRGGRRRGGSARARLRPADLGRPADLAAGRQGRGPRRRVRRARTSSSPGSAASSRAPASRSRDALRATRSSRSPPRSRST